VCQFLWGHTAEKSNFTDIFSHPVYNSLISFQRLQVIRITVTPPIDFGVLKTSNHTINYMPLHNTAVTVNKKCTPFATTQEFGRFKNSFTAISIVHRVRLSSADFLEFGDVFALGRYLLLTSNIFPHVVIQRVKSGKFTRQIFF